MTCLMLGGQVDFLSFLPHVCIGGQMGKLVFVVLQVSRKKDSVKDPFPVTSVYQNLLTEYPFCLKRSVIYCMWIWMLQFSSFFPAFSHHCCFHTYIYPLYYVVVLLSGDISFVDVYCWAFTKFKMVAWTCINQCM